MTASRIKKIAALGCALLLAAAPVSALAEEAAPELQSVPLAAGFLHSAIIDADEVLWTAGDNTYGQLGVGASDAEPEEEAASQPESAAEAETDIPADSETDGYVRVMDNAKAVFAGYLTTLVIDNTGMLYGFGWNEGAQLGLGNRENQYEPEPIMGNVVTAATGRFHTAAVTGDGTLWTWGWNMIGQLGNGTTETIDDPKEALEDVRAVAVGLQHTMAVKTDNTLWAAGDNTYGQLGNGSTSQLETFTQVLENVEDVVCTAFGTIILKTDGTVWACGYNANGELGNGTTDNISAPVQILDHAAAIACGENFSAAISDTGDLYVWGNDSYQQYAEEASLSPLKIAEGVTDAALGGGHLLYLTEDGVVHAQGNNEFGQLGNGSLENSAEPVEVASEISSPTIEAARETAENRVVLPVVIGLIVAVAALFAWLIFRTLKGKPKKPQAPKPAKAPKAPKEEGEKKLSDKELIAAAQAMAQTPEEPAPEIDAEVESAIEIEPETPAEPQPEAAPAPEAEPAPTGEPAVEPAEAPDVENLDDAITRDEE